MPRSGSNTTEEVLTVNGISLNTWAKNIESLAGRLSVAAFRTENVQVPGRHGTLRVPNKVFDENTIVLPMWIAGCADDGSIPSGSTARRELYKRVDEVTKLFKGGTAALDIRHTLPDGSVRQAFGDVLEAFDFTTDASPMGLVSVSIVMPDPFWRDVNEMSQSIQANGTNGNFDWFGGATAPMQDLQYKLRGPWINPRLTFADGSFVDISVNIPGGTTLVLDAGSWTIRAEGTPTSFTGYNGTTYQFPQQVIYEDMIPTKSPTGASLIPNPTGVSFRYSDGFVLTNEGWNWDVSKVTHDGQDPVWATLPGTSQVVTFGGSGRTSSTQLTIVGRRKFLVG